MLQRCWEKAGFRLSVSSKTAVSTKMLGNAWVGLVMVSGGYWFEGFLPGIGITSYNIVPKKRKRQAHPLHLPLSLWDPSA
jgi:hypothetical protein